MSNEIVPQVFDSPEFGSVRVVRDEGGEPWFVAGDMTKGLDWCRERRCRGEVTPDA